MNGSVQYSEEGNEDLLHSVPTHPSNSDGYLGFDQRLDNSYYYAPDEDYEDLDADNYTSRKGQEHESVEGAFVSPPFQSSIGDYPDEDSSRASSLDPSLEFRNQPKSSPVDTFVPSPEFSDETSKEDLFGAFQTDGAFNGAVLPQQEEMQWEEGLLLREWKRTNAICLEGKTRNERERLSQIIDGADGFKDEFHGKRRIYCVTSKKVNREKEKIFLENLENFHSTAEKQYWKAVTELISQETPFMESKFGGKNEKKKTNCVATQGPKPGKATDLTRMRQVLLKLKQNPPPHMIPPPVPQEAMNSCKTAAQSEAPAPLQWQGSSQVAAAEA